MDAKRETSKRLPVAISAVVEQTIVETIYRSKAFETAFVIGTPNGTEIAATWNNGTETFRPVAPTNNLVKHQAVVFPSELGEFVSTETLLGEIGDYVRNYVSLSDEAVALASAYVLLTWVYDAFNELPYLRFRGDYGTGKTRALLVIGSLTYKAFFASGASTVSPIFHTLNTFRGTLIFDEADFRFTDEKAELVKILNNGNAKGFPVLRTEVSNTREFNPRAFVIYGPKIVGMRRAYEDRALESRFLTIEMEPGRASGVPINLPEAQKDQAQVLRNKLLAFRLRNRLSASLDPSRADPRLEPRMNQILLPLLSVAPTADMRAAIASAATIIQEGIISERGASAEGQALTILTRLISDQSDEKVTLADISAAFTAAYGAEYERPVTNRWVGSLLRRLGIPLYKSHGVFVVPPKQKDRLKALSERYGLGADSENPD